jgi:DNA polymerase III subunit beta
MISSNPTFEAMTQAMEAAGQLPCELKFSVKQDVLSSVLTQLVKATYTLRDLPHLANILIVARPSINAAVSDQVIMTSTDLSTALCLQVEAQVQHEGAFTIPAKMLLKCVMAFSKSDILTIEVQELRVLVTCGTLTLRLLGGLPAGEFPDPCLELVEGPSAPYVINSDVLRQAIKEVQSFTTDDDKLRVFTAICLHMQQDRIDLVACDTSHVVKRTVMQMEILDGLDVEILVPVEALRLLASVMPSNVEVDIVWDKDRSRIMFQAGHVSLVSRLVEGYFPNIAYAIPASHATVFSLTRSDLVQMLKAFKPFCRESANRLCLSYQTSGLVVFQAQSEDLGNGENILTTAVEGPSGEMTINMQLLEYIVQNVRGESFQFCLSGKVKPGVIVPVGRDDCLTVFMPIFSHNDC